MHNKHGFIVCANCNKTNGTLKKDGEKYVHTSCEFAAAQRAAIAANVRKVRNS